MGYDLSLTTADGHTLEAYSAMPDGEPKAGMVIIQEIFGVNEDIRETVDNFSKQGYHAIAPALFDRSESNVVLGFDEEGMTKGIELKNNLINKTKLSNILVKNLSSYYMILVEIYILFKQKQTYIY